MKGIQVRILDNLLHSQITVSDAEYFPQYLSPEVETYTGDIRDRKIVDKALNGVRCNLSPGIGNPE